MLLPLQLMVTMASCEGTASPTGGSVLHPGVSENGLSRRLLTSVSLDRKDALIEMLVCTLDGDLYPPLEEPTGTVDPKKEKVKDEVKSFVWNHGMMEYQVQVDGVKAKLKETGASKKQQEDLIMKVENQLASLQEQLDSLIEK
ncbi:transcription initiation factor TFIID subunit 7 isoform X2 [Oncorhynchus kisutch]|uniref:transcription initiation factor TFIID subunit 7 isoform X2 n=1 Tax=Oncorhynchus kisutch TaxID=8019 RepID=UPI0012DC34AA|nr:transcription initiation factor TFIID subunit 7-like isoform X2 [Oncorhynchus kisutch]